MKPIFSISIKLVGLGSVFPLYLIIEEIILKHVKHIWWMITVHPEDRIMVQDVLQTFWFKLYWDDD